MCKQGIDYHTLPKTPTTWQPSLLRPPLKNESIEWGISSRDLSRFPKRPLQPKKNTRAAVFAPNDFIETQNKHFPPPHAQP